MGKSQQRRLDEAAMRFRREMRGRQFRVKKSEIDVEKATKPSKKESNGNSKTQRKSSRFA